MNITKFAVLWNVAANLLLLLYLSPSGFPCDIEASRWGRGVESFYASPRTATTEWSYDIHNKRPYH